MVFPCPLCDEGKLDTVDGPPIEKCDRCGKEDTTPYCTSCEQGLCGNCLLDAIGPPIKPRRSLNIFVPKEGVSSDLYMYLMVYRNSAWTPLNDDSTLKKGELLRYRGATTIYSLVDDAECDSNGKVRFSFRPFGEIL